MVCHIAMCRKVSSVCINKFTIVFICLRIYASVFLCLTSIHDIGLKSSIMF